MARRRPRVLPPRPEGDDAVLPPGPALPLGPEGDAARLVLSGSFARRVARIEAWLIPMEISATARVAIRSDPKRSDPSPGIRDLLDRALTEMKARRYRLAVEWLKRTENQWRVAAATLAELHRRGRAAEADQAEAELEHQRPLVAHAVAIREGAAEARREARFRRKSRQEELMPVIAEFLRASLARSLPRGPWPDSSMGNSQSARPSRTS